MSKNMLLFLSWVFVEQTQCNFCWAIQLLLSPVCPAKGYCNPREMLGRDQDCLLHVEEARSPGTCRLCSLFLLGQPRIFSATPSYTWRRPSKPFAVCNAASLKSIDVHHKADKSLAQLHQAEAPAGCGRRWPLQKPGARSRQSLLR